MLEYEVCNRPRCWDVPTSGAIDEPFKEEKPNEKKEEIHRLDRKITS